MDEQLKQRIVGIMVITALAAIFIPMLFDEPISNADSYRYTLALPTQPSNTLQESIQSLPSSQQDVLTASNPVSRQLTPLNPPPSNQDTTMKKWIIQVGSFGLRKNAEEFQERLRKQKFTAYIKPVQQKSRILFQLLVGPELDYTRAQNEQQRLQTLFNTKTQLSSQ